MRRDLKYLIAYLLPLSAYVAVLWQGLWSFAAVVLAFGILPLVEQFVGGGTCNLSEEEEAKKAASPLPVRKKRTSLAYRPTACLAPSERGIASSYA